MKVFYISYGIKLQILAKFIKISFFSNVSRRLLVSIQFIYICRLVTHQNQDQVLIDRMKFQHQIFCVRTHSFFPKSITNTYIFDALCKMISMAYSFSLVPLLFLFFWSKCLAAGQICVTVMSGKLKMNPAGKHGW